MLKRPPGKQLGDAFYRDVARAYVEAVGHGLNPRAAIAADTGASSELAGRWIYHSRKRGYLPATQPGTVAAGYGDVPPAYGHLPDMSTPENRATVQAVQAEVAETMRRKREDDQ